MWRVERDYRGIRVIYPDSTPANTRRLLVAIRPSLGIAYEPVAGTNQVQTPFPSYQGGWGHSVQEARAMDAAVDKHLTELFGDIPRLALLELKAAPMEFPPPSTERLLAVARAAVQDEFNPNRGYYASFKYSVAGLFDKGRFIAE